MTAGGSGDRRPRIGITWGSQVDTTSLRKLTSYVRMVEDAGGLAIALVPGTKLETALANLPRTGLSPFPDLPVNQVTVAPFEIRDGDAAAPEQFDGLLFAGGRDIEPDYYGEPHETDTLDIDSGRDSLELPLIRRTLAAGIPFLGICRGLQVLNVALGGALYQDIPTQHDGAAEHREGAFHEVRLAPGSHLAALAGTDRLVTNSWHHQGIKLPRGLAPDLRATAFAPDGVIEACEAEPGRFPGYLLAVQWHPERRSADESAAFLDLSRKLFQDFTAACKECRTTAVEG